MAWVRPDVDWGAWLEGQAEFGAGFKPVMVPERFFNRALQRAFERAGAAADAVQDLDAVVDLQAATAELPETADLLDSQDDAPIIRLLNAVMTQAIEEGASDIHIEPFETRVVIRSGWTASCAMWWSRQRPCPGALSPGPRCWPA